MQKFLALFSLLFTFNLAIAGPGPTPSILMDAPAGTLMDHSDPVLQSTLENILKANPTWKSLIRQKRMSVGLVDLNDELNPRFASVNGDHMMYAASLPKIAVLFAAMDAIENGTLEDTPVVRQDMWLMISKSNNAASTRMIDRVGFQAIEDILCDARYNFYDEENGGGLWVGKRYAAAGKKNPDPIKGLSHAASVNSICRFYYQMATGQLVSEQRSAEMLSIMENPSLHHKFVNTLDRIAPDARLFRKSGSWKSWHSDSILVWGEDGRKYILTALIESKNGEQIIRNLVKPAEKALRNSRTLS